MPERGTRPVNKYLPPLSRDTPENAPRSHSRPCSPGNNAAPGRPATSDPPGFLGWIDRALARL